MLVCRYVKLASTIPRSDVYVEPHVLMHERGVLLIASTVTHCMHISHLINNELVAAPGRSISNGSTEKRRSPGILVEIVTDRRTLQSLYRCRLLPHGSERTLYQEVM
jgi:hypothetical protein